MFGVSQAYSYVVDIFSVQSLLGLCELYYFMHKEIHISCTTSIDHMITCSIWLYKVKPQYFSQEKNFIVLPISCFFRKEPHLVHIMNRQTFLWKLLCSHCLCYLLQFVIQPYVLNKHPHDLRCPKFRKILSSNLVLSFILIS